MPLFEYKCATCQSQFELLIRGADVPTCPNCQSTSLDKVLSSFGVTSADTQWRHRQALGADQRRKSETVQKERSFYKSDHHDD